MQLANITQPFVLLCEGMHDSEFFRNLISSRNLPDFEICSVNYVLGASTNSGGGNTRFTEALDALPALPGFEGVQKILVVADNDQNPNNEFQRIVGAINATAPIIGPPASKFTAPGAPQTKAGKNPEIVVLMLPWTGVLGSLSTMCLQAAQNAAPKIAKCVDQLASCAGADNWPQNKLAKMKLHTIIASSHQQKPNLSPAYVWSENTNLVPLGDTIFDQVAAFLQGFPAM